MPDFHDINHPGFSFFPSKQKEPEGEEITEIEEQKPEEKKEPEVRFLSARFKAHELHGYTINKPVIVEGSVEYLRPTEKTRVEIELYGTYNDKEEECFVVDRRKRFANINDDNTFRFEIPLYCPQGYDHHKNRDKITDPLSYRAEITHSAHEKPIDDVKLDLPDGTENPVLQKGMYDDKACELYPDRCTKNGEGYLEGSPVAKLQEILIKFRYLDQGNPDGDFGKKTDAAVRSFQKDAMKDKRLHLEEIKVVTADETRFKGPVDGIVGSQTRAEIDFWQRHKWARPVPDFYRGDYDYESVMQKKREYQGDDFHDDYPIKEIQEKFQKVNLYQGFDIDGIFEDKMKSAVEEFQDLAEKGEFAAVADNTRVVNVKPLSGYRKGVLCYKTQDCLEGVVEKEKKDPEWMKIAKDEIGEKEIKGEKHNPQVIKYHSTTTLKAATDEIPWCSSFVNWVMSKSGYEGTNSARAMSWAKWGKKLVSPVYGCIVVIDYSYKGEKYKGKGHVGFAVGKDGQNALYLLGGNQADSVKISKYNCSSIEKHLTYVIPDNCDCNIQLDEYKEDYDEGTYESTR